jgi:PAS domain S-box-containing protein
MLDEIEARDGARPAWLSSIGARVAKGETALGAPETWTDALKSAVGLISNSGFPMFLVWGPDQTLVYNDAYAPILADKHPAALGASFWSVWPEVRDQIEPVIEAAFAGRPSFFENLEVTLLRAGAPGRAWFTFSYSPVYDSDGAIPGVLCVCMETTSAVLALATQRAREEVDARQRFLDRLTAETAHLADADELLATTTRMVGEHLQVSVCAYADMDDDQDAFTIRGDWSAPGSPTIVGRYKLAAFGRMAVENLSRGLPLVINDNLKEIAPEEAATFQAIGISATICMPLVKEGRLRALMAIHHRAPHVWTDGELALIREVTERSWAHVERVGAEAELRASEEQLRLITDAVPVLISYIDADHRYRFMNRGYEAWFGRPIEELQGKHLSEVLGREPYETARPRLEEALSGQRVSFQTEMDYKDAGRRVIQAEYVPHLAPSGKVLGVHALVSDITERAAAEREVLESRAELARRLNAIPQMVWSTRPDGHHDFFNDRWYEFTGVERGDTDGGGWIDVFHPDDWTRALERWTHSLETGDIYEIEYRLRHRSGDFRWVLGRALPIRDEDGRIVRWMGTCTDIDELKRTADELQRTSALLKLISDSTPDLVYAKDRESRLIYVNPAAAGVIGRPIEQLIGHSDLEWADDKAQAQAIVENDRQVMREGAVLDVDEVFTSPDGRTRTFRSLKAPLRSPSGEVIGLVGMTSDITERLLAVERERLLAREVDHRAKNLLTIVQSIIRLTPRHDAESFVHAVENRIHALSRVHGLLATNRWDGAELAVLVREELAAFAAARPERVTISGEDVRLGPEAAQGLAMILHELTTNAAKYGALSTASGRLAISWRRDGDDLVLQWTESGGPAVSPPRRRGFGSQLMVGTVERQLHGKVEMTWESAGLNVRIRVPTTSPEY